MAIQGWLESVNRRAINGWCVDDEVEGIVEVVVRVGAVTLGVVRADRPRQDIKELLGRPVAGFNFPIHSSLAHVLPHGARVEVASKSGVPLAPIEGIDVSINNPGVAEGRLDEMLGDGYIINPKYGQIIRPLGSLDIEDKLFRALATGNRLFAELFSKQFFICYGTLLGCMREDDFIAYDDDVDVCFLADAEGLEAAAEEFNTVVSTLREHGQEIAVDSCAQFHWGLEGTSLDVFMAWTEGDRLYMFNAGGRFPRTRIEPFVQHVFKGREVLIPQAPEALLELIYGPGWKLPDPSFQWRPTEEIRAKMKEMNAMSVVDLRTHNKIKRYWSRFYEQVHTAIPTPFAASVAVELGDKHLVVDLGCGNGRDSLFFASLGHRVHGFDLASSAIESCQARATDLGLDGATFQQLDICKPGLLREMLRATSESDDLKAPPVVYARFFFHAITEDEQALIIRALADGLPARSLCFFEFRTDKDEGTYKRIAGHYRRFVELDRFVARALRKGAFECIYRIEGQGMAKYLDEDPFVARVYLRRV